MHSQAGSIHHTLRTMLLATMLLPLAALFAPGSAVAQGPGTRYIACLDQADMDLATCYWLAEDRWRERFCNFAYYADTISCSLDFFV